MNTRTLALSGAALAALAATAATASWSVPLSVVQETAKKAGTVTIDLDNADPSVVIEKLSRAGVNFVIETSSIPRGAKFSIHLKRASKDQVAEAVAKAFGLHVTKKGDVYLMQSGASSSDPFELPSLEGGKFRLNVPKEGSSSWKLEDGKWQFMDKDGKWRDSKEAPDTAPFIPGLGGRGGLEMKDVPMLDQKAFEKLKFELKDLPPLQWREFNAPEMDQKALDEWKKQLKDLPPLRWRELKVPQMDQKALDEWKKAMKDHPSFKLKDFEAPQMDQRALDDWQKQLKDLPPLQWREFTAPQMDQKAPDDWKKAMKDHPSFKLKDFKAPQMDEKAWRGLESRLKFALPGDAVRGKVGVFGAGLSSLIESLTSAQMDKMKSQGYLKASDLTPEQRTMLGDWGPNDKFEFTIERDGRKITIKSG